ncbi:hypothetical protein BGZ97_007162 [Linnemannia gamsii]|jgi:hypothetical protein|uniref:F-box domain-containing protein n=1 Tax=Linnemannia gamsii TaxID=64522 RepID=A0A9P6QSG8_9FUNG|nr:hypothetical protein BGZ97_007162 [Linnemannia gamsii]
MAPIRRSRRLEQKATDAQDDADAPATQATAAEPAAGTKTPTRTAPKRNATARTKKTPVASRAAPAARPKGAKRSSTRQASITTVAAAASPPKKVRAAKLTTAKANSKGKARATASTIKSRQVNTSGDGDVDMKVTGGEDDAPNAMPKAKGRQKGKGKSMAKKDKDETKAKAAPEDGKEAKPKLKRAKKVKDETAAATEEKEPRPKTKRTKKVKVETATDTAVRAGAETVAKAVGKGKAKAKRTKTEDDDSTAPTASTGRKKRKIDPENYVADDGGADGSGAASSTQLGPASKKQRTTTGKKRGAAKAPVEPPKPIIINKSDPYSVLPTELWQEVMLYLSLSQIAKTSTVSKGWLEGTRSLQVWRDVCSKAALGKPMKKYPTHMGLVCAQSYWICEQCLTMNNGKGSDIPMPVEIAELANERLMLCRYCRCQYYRKHPEETKLRKNVTNHYGEYVYEHDVRITKTQACDSYHLRDEDLWSLDCLEKRNPHYRNAAPMRLYLEEEVQERSLEIHGGWIGIKAVRRGVAKTRREAAKTRAQGLQTRVVLNPKKKKDADMSGKGKKPMTEAEAKASHEKSVQSWVKMLRQPDRKTQLVQAIAEAEERVATGQPPLVIKTTTLDRKWIDSVRNLFNKAPLQREAIKKIIQAFDAGVYDTQGASSSSTAGAATAGAGAGPSSSSTAQPHQMATTCSVA